MRETSDARRYARIRYRVMLIEWVLGFAFLVLAQWSGMSDALAGWWSQHVAGEPLILLGYLAVLGGASYVIFWPLHFYASFLLEHRFGLSRLTPAAWWVREAKQVAVSAILTVLLLEGFYVALRHAPDTWVVWATCGWILVSVVLTRIFPTVLLPIFYPTAPVADQALVERLLRLCQRVGVQALGVFSVQLSRETRKANAALVGFGKTRRVLLSDTLQEQFPPEEIEGVLAHELAHHRYRHLLKGLALSAVGSWIAFTATDVVGQRWVAWLGLRDLSDIAGFPVVMLCLSLVRCLGLPVQHVLARHCEWQADRFAVATTSPSAFANALRRLASLNLADPAPPRWVVWWCYDHPPITDRIRAASREF